MIKLEADLLHVNRSGKNVLNGVSFTVEAGEIYALLGGNGAGKSTTLLSFLGFIKPHSGKVYVNQTNVYSDIAIAREDIAYLPETASLYEHLNAYENIEYFLQLANLPITKASINIALDNVSLKEEDRYLKLTNYSKGMRQKVMIALAILRDTNILLLDEPTSGLDPKAIDEFHQLIRNLANKGKAILMVTHDVYGACSVADKVGLLHNATLMQEFNAKKTKIDTQTIHKAFSLTTATQDA